MHCRPVPEIVALHCSVHTVHNRTVFKQGSWCTVQQGKVSCLQKFQHFWMIIRDLFFDSGSTKAVKIKRILQRYVIYISDQITVTYLNIETGNRCLNIGGWYVFARRKGLKIYFFSTNSLNYVKYFLTIWWNKHRRFQCKENMTVNALIFLTTGAPHPGRESNPHQWW
jgi:hypothetical protein